MPERRHGYDAELLHERQHVRDAPVLASQARAVEPHDVDELHIHALAPVGGTPMKEPLWVPVTLTRVREFVAFPDQVLDVHA